MGGLIFGNCSVLIGEVAWRECGVQLCVWMSSVYTVTVVTLCRVISYGAWSL